MDHRERSSELEQEADQMEERKERFEEHLDDTRQDWESKQSGDSVPGAQEEEALDDSPGSDESDAPAE